MQSYNDNLSKDIIKDKKNLSLRQIPTELSTNEQYYGQVTLIPLKTISVYNCATILLKKMLFTEL